MANLEELREDLDFVAGAVRGQRVPPKPEIYLMWAALLPAGFALSDFAPRYSGWYWLLAAPLGTLVSLWLGRTAAARQGVRDAARLRRAGLHWLAVLLAFLLFGAAVGSGRVDVRSSAPNWVPIAALGHTLAGIHLQRGLLWTGLVLFLGYAVLIWAPLPYLWTSIGLIVAAALVAAAICDRGTA